MRVIKCKSYDAHYDTILSLSYKKICGLDPKRKDYQAEGLPRNQSNKSCIRRQFRSACECRVRVLRVTVQDRIDCSFSAVYAKLRAWKLYSSVHRRHAASNCSVCSRARPMACARRRPAQGFFLSRSIPHSNSCWQSRTNCCPQVLWAISRSSLVFRGVCFSVRPPAARCRPAKAAATGVCRLASRIFVDGRSVVHLLSTPHSVILLIPLKPPLISSPRITVFAAISWYYSIHSFLIGSLVNIPLGNHSAR